MTVDNMDEFRDENGLLPCVCFGPEDPVESLPDVLLESLVESGDPRPELVDELRRRGLFLTLALMGDQTAEDELERQARAEYESYVCTGSTRPPREA